MAAQAMELFLLTVYNYAPGAGSGHSAGAVQPYQDSFAHVGSYRRRLMLADVDAQIEYLMLYVFCRVLLCFAPYGMQLAPIFGKQAQSSCVMCCTWQSGLATPRCRRTCCLMAC
jgi:hypothetical protein